MFLYLYGLASSKMKYFGSICNVNTVCISHKKLHVTYTQRIKKRWVVTSGILNQLHFQSYSPMSNSNTQIPIIKFKKKTTYTLPIHPAQLDELVVSFSFFLTALC